MIYTSKYNVPTFDTVPTEPQPHGVQTTFHFMVLGRSGRSGYVELCYTLTQDFTLFGLMQEQNIDVWREKLDCMDTLVA
jgi:hypothetical protein